MIIPVVADALAMQIVGVDTHRPTGNKCAVCGCVDGFVRHGDELLCSSCTAWHYNMTHGYPSPWLKETVQ